MTGTTERAGGKERVGRREGERGRGGARVDSFQSTRKYFVKWFCCCAQVSHPLAQPPHPHPLGISSTGFGLGVFGAFGFRVWLNRLTSLLLFSLECVGQFQWSSVHRIATQRMAYIAYA